ncbi:predicted protein [Histoplasma capsulatum var. duboisii H88]|uniref:Predicted protein n=1 Tax=Ajellomyces capsulatus (strain H88) TaxID=544711 RepID=F0US76_AJEC8|nr:predicted protein [Histoplasma capsulatum var. duboisii H88]
MAKPYNFLSMLEGVEQADLDSNQHSKRMFCNSIRITNKTQKRGDIPHRQGPSCFLPRDQQAHPENKGVGTITIKSKERKTPWDTPMASNDCQVPGPWDVTPFRC